MQIQYIKLIGEQIITLQLGEGPRALPLHLKELRLPIMLREYDKVARQCAVEQLDYQRYLLRMTITFLSLPTETGARLLRRTGWRAMFRMRVSRPFVRSAT
jgi:hypothetical protein